MRRSNLNLIQFDQTTKPSLSLYWDSNPHANAQTHLWTPLWFSITLLQGEKLAFLISIFWAELRSFHRCFIRIETKSFPTLNIFNSRRMDLKSFLFAYWYKRLVKRYPYSINRWVLNNKIKNCYYIELN